MKTMNASVKRIPNLCKKMQVRYEIRESTDRGKGVFALEKIPKGTCVWKFFYDSKEGEADNVAVYNESELRKHFSVISDEERDRIIDLAFADYGLKPYAIMVPLDDSQYFNHSHEHNCGWYHLCYEATKSNRKEVFKLPEARHTYALRDIEIGEEIFENYEEYEYPSWFINLLNEYQKLPSYADLHTFSGYSMSSMKSSTSSITEDAINGNSPSV